MDLQVMTMVSSFILEVMAIKVVILVGYLKEDLEFIMIVREVKELEKLLSKEVISKLISASILNIPEIFKPASLRKRNWISLLRKQ